MNLHTAKKKKKVTGNPIALITVFIWGCQEQRDVKASRNAYQEV